ncbi:MAG: hypothetical protein EOP56_13935 [Sphingobacteriales bacterium]|nr:MAG: hypothetical protein EOP56_13935 [Sphingobacteriales bacterium]
MLQSITKDSIIVSDRAFSIADVKTIQYKIDESESAPVALGWASIICIIASPFAGITKDGYRFDKAGATLGAGVGLFGILAFATRNRHLRTYTITGVK